jgi:glycosyltransferase involved in cell wall biosynthesis
LGQQLAARGHQVHFVSYALPFRLDKFDTNVMYHGVETTAYPLFKFPPYALTLAAKMAEVSRSFQLDILHVHYAVPHATCAYLARQLLAQDGGKMPKIITTLHGTDITLVGSDPSFYDITRFSILASDGITAVSNYLADETKRVFRIDKEIRVIHNFIDDKRFRPKTTQCNRIDFASDDEALVMHISNFRPVKRTLDVIDVFDRIAREIPAKRNLTDKVIFLGNQSRVEAILPCADLFLLPSEEESFGLAALEALACGVPVIGTSGTGLVEVVEDYRNGFLLPVGDTSSMARAAVSLLKDKPRLAEFKTSAATSAQQRFGAEKIVSQYEKHYEDVLHG